MYNILKERVVVVRAQNASYDMQKTVTSARTVAKNRRRMESN